MAWTTTKCFILLLLVLPCYSQTGDETIALYNTLFTNYSKYVRPNKDHSRPMQIDLDMFLVGINDLDEVEGKLTTTAFLWISWSDEYLTWTEPMSVIQIYTSQDNVWKPDLTLKNGFTKLKELGSTFVQVKILGIGGFVLWQPFEIFESKCPIKIVYFPFDKQSCELEFVVWSSGIEDVNVTLGSKGINLEEYEEGLEWKIKTTSATEDKEGTESRVTFFLTIERNSGYYIFNILIPVILLGLLNVFTFVIPADSGEKMGYSMTVFLSFAVFLTIVSSELPKASGSYLGYYLMALLGFGVITVCFTAIELRLHFRTTPVPERLVRILKCACCCNRNKVGDSEIDLIKRRNEKPMTWTDVTAKLDCIMFWLLLTTFLLVTAMTLIVLQLRL